MSAITAAPDDSGWRGQVTMRIENPSGQEQEATEVGIICSEGAERGGSQVDSTMSAGEPIPAGTFLDATQFLLLPGDDRIGEAVPPCAEPAVIEVAPLNTDETAVWAIPAGVVSAA